MKVLLGLATAFAFVWSPALAENRIDRIRPDAPELAAHGEYAIGARTIEVVHTDQIDILQVEDGKDLPRYDRPLTLEIWYPAISSGEPTPYEVFLRDGKTAVVIHGRATRDAPPDRTCAPYELVLISHGYPGNRFLLSHLGENLASKGYVVASIDHTDSTYRSRAAFASTLVNRALDQLFVLDEMERLSADDAHFLAGMVNSDQVGLIGYSMGGYGAVITAGAGVTQEAVDQGAPRGTLGIHLAGSEAHRDQFDDRIKAVVAFAPWGMELGFWNAEGLAAMRIPTLFVAGSVDDVSGYDEGIRAIFEQAVGIERFLLTFENANHNAAAPMPAPTETFEWDTDSGPSPFGHYADPVWDTVRMNNIAQHFVTAYFGKHLKGRTRMGDYLDLVPDSNLAVWAVEEDGSQKPEHTYWKGFQNRTAKGLRLEKLDAGE